MSIDLEDIIRREVNLMLQIEDTYRKMLDEYELEAEDPEVCRSVVAIYNKLTNLPGVGK